MSTSIANLEWSNWPGLLHWFSFLENEGIFTRLSTKKGRLVLIINNNNNNRWYPFHWKNWLDYHQRRKCFFFSFFCSHIRENWKSDHTGMLSTHGNQTRARALCLNLSVNTSEDGVNSFWISRCTNANAFFANKPMAPGKRPNVRWTSRIRKALWRKKDCLGFQSKERWTVAW